MLQIELALFKIRNDRSDKQTQADDAASATGLKQQKDTKLP